ncbi:MAG: hypothetical protein JWL60_197 [Gemmatimonadetes bacterium]|jgi:hypothetical protein|nr:hypothetical protein [Gemmatimonadota bacterium]
MPTDLALSTNTSTSALELRQAQAMPDGSGYAAMLIVRSGGFAAAVPYFVDTAAWQRFGEGLAEVAAGGEGVAELEGRGSADRVRVANAGDGLVAVSGTLHEREGAQELRFRFTTSARGLDALVEGVARLGRG